MINLINYLLEANFILLFFALIYYALLSQQSNFQFRRLFILIATCCVLVVPLISISLGENIIPGVVVPSGIATIVLDEVVVGAGLEQTSPFSFNLHWTTYLVLFYSLISSIFLIGFINQLLSIGKIFYDKSMIKSKTNK